MSDYQEIFPKRLKELRLKRGKTQDDLAEFLGMQRTSIAHYEMGRNLPATETIAMIADFLGTSIDYLLGRVHESEISGKRMNITLESLEDLPLSYNGESLSEETKKHLVLMFQSVLELSKKL